MKARTDGTVSAAPAVGKPAGHYRYVVLGVVWLTFCTAAFDRSNVSLLLVDPGFLRDMGLEGSPERQGLVMSAALLPYALSNIFLSFAADRWGPRRVLSLMALAFSVVAAFLMMVVSYPVLLMGRAARGAAEGPLFPIANRYVSNWFPPSESAWASALWTSGQRMGLALSVPLLTAVIAGFGWRASFLVQMLLILVLTLPAIWFLTADRPEQMHRVGKEERAVIAGAKPKARGKGAGWRADLPALLKNYRYWLMVAHHFGVLAVYYGLLTWLPKYLKVARGFDVAGMVLFAALPHLMSTAAALPFGLLADRIGRRAVFCAGGLMAAGLCICLAALATDSVASAWLMVLGIAFWGISPPAYYAIMHRVVPGSIMATGIGIDNGLANLGAALAPTAVGFLIGATGSYLAGLLFLAGLAFLGAAAAGVLAAQRY